jgi:hypothetical protein
MGGERSGAAAGRAEVRHGAGGEDAADLLAQEVNAAGGLPKQLKAVATDSISEGQLEIWIGS